MNTSEAIRARRSIRKYKKGTVIPKEHIHQMLEAAMMRPVPAIPVPGNLLWWKQRKSGNRL